MGEILYANNNNNTAFTLRQDPSPPPAHGRDRVSCMNETADGKVKTSTFELDNFKFPPILPPREGGGGGILLWAEFHESSNT